MCSEIQNKRISRAGGAQLARNPPAMPSQLAGMPLTAAAPDGRKYCVLFQSLQCQADALLPLCADRREWGCRFGLHSCAVVLDSGRSCHGSHPAIHCQHSTGGEPTLPRDPADSVDSTQRYEPAGAVSPRDPADDDEATQYYEPAIVPPPKRRKEEPSEEVSGPASCPAHEERAKLLSDLLVKKCHF